MYKPWVRQDMISVWSYLTGLQGITSDAMENGKDVHKFLEEHTLHPVVKKIIGKGVIKKEEKIEVEFDNYKAVGILDVSSKNWIVDYKTGSTLNGYKKQLEFYAYLKFLKTGKIPPNGLLVLVEGLRKKDKVVEVEVLKTAMYELGEKCLYWADVLYEMNNDIQEKINSGKLDKFLKLNNGN